MYSPVVCVKKDDGLKDSHKDGPGLSVRQNVGIQHSGTAWI